MAEKIWPKRGFSVGPRKVESQMAEEKKAEKICPLARARFGPLALDSANFPV
jgi:hypothetical protein